MANTKNNTVLIPPLGKAVLGHKTGDVVTVKVSEDYSYDVEIRKIENTEVEIFSKCI